MRLGRAVSEMWIFLGRFAFGRGNERMGQRHDTLGNCSAVALALPWWEGSALNCRSALCSI